MPNKVSYSRKYIYKKDSENKTVLVDGKPVLEKIVVTASKPFGMWGETVSASAVCVDVDRFDFEAGKALAKARLDIKLSEFRIKNDERDMMKTNACLTDMFTKLQRQQKKREKHLNNLNAARYTEAKILNSFED